MKKSIIILVILTIFSLIIFVAVNKKSEPAEFKYNNVYRRVTNNYINDELYSITTETITLLNGALSYESYIIYEDESISPIKLASISKYEEKQDRIITKSKTYYLNSEKICLESIDCEEPFTTNLYSTDNKISNFKKKNYYTTVSEVKPSKEGNELYVIASSEELTKEYKSILENIAYDFDVKVNVVKLTKKNKKELTEKYDIKDSPKLVLYKNGELRSSEENINTHDQIALYLYLRGIDYR